MRSSKPILIGGITLTAGLWALEQLKISPFPLENLGILTAIAFGGSLWLLQKKGKGLPMASPPTTLTQTEVNQMIDQTKLTFAILEKEAIEQDISNFKSALQNLDQPTETNSFKINIIGGKYTGKTTLQNLLKTKLEPEITFQETLAENSINQENYDLILYIINQDLTDSQWQDLQKLKQLNYRLILLLNKQDRYLPEEKFLILQQLKTRVKSIIPEKDILAIATQPIPIKVRQYQKDGNIQEYLEPQLPQIDDFVKSLAKILREEKAQLKLEKNWRNAFLLKEEITTKINEIRREKSLPIIEKYQWIAAGATFANPIASLDLIATAAINGQLLIDLSEIYEQKFTLEQGKNLASIMGELMVKLGVVEITTQTISSFLKSHALTYMAGGTLQGISASYLTRIAGLSLIAYYEEQELTQDQQFSFNWDQIGEKIKQIFQENQRIDFYKNLINLS